MFKTVRTIWKPISGLQVVFVKIYKHETNWIANVFTETRAPSFSYSIREIVFSGIVTGSVVTNTGCPDNYHLGTNSLL